ncbi:MAG: aminotransferase class IV family protein [Burkholderiales bacterium]|nr:aminotransferase class IV family protein [Phycisphaerae bacterium]
MSNTAWLNGNLIDESDATVSIRDSGLLHAIGIFTTMRAAGGRVIQLAQHLRRLRESSDALFVPLQFSDEELKQAISILLEQNTLSEARLRITVTRGMAHNDPLHGVRVEPTTFITAGEFEPYPAEYLEKGLTVAVVDDQKANPYDLQAGHKTLNYFSRLAALREANRRGAGEALWFNVHNFLQSGCISNVFIVRDQTLITPPTNEDLRDADIKTATPYPRSNVLPGTTRGAVFEIAADEGIAVRIGPITINELLAAEEVFVTNSVMGVMPVCRIERKEVGNEKPGAITRRLMAGWDRIVLED